MSPDQETTQIRVPKRHGAHLNWWLILFRDWPRLRGAGADWSRLRMALVLVLGIGPLIFVLLTPFSVERREIAAADESVGDFSAVTARPAVAAGTRGGQQPVAEAVTSLDGTRGTATLVHAETVGVLAYGPAGEVLATGTHDGAITVWDLRMGEVERRIDAHDGAVFSLAFSPDGRYLASGSGDPSKAARDAESAIAVWDLRSGEQVRTLRGHRGVVASLAISPFGGVLASAGHDRSVRIWDLTAGNELRTLPTAPGAVLAVAFSPNGEMLATVDHGAIQLWSTRDYQPLSRLEGHEDFVSSLAFSADGALLASGSMDRTVRVWTLDESVAPEVLTGHEAGVTSVAFHPDGRCLASAGYDKKIKLWTLAGGKPREILGDRDERCAEIEFDAQGRLAAARGEVVELATIAGPATPR